jgi:hypothetical protein
MSPVTCRSCADQHPTPVAPNLPSSAPELPATWPTTLVSSPGGWGVEGIRDGRIDHPDPMFDLETAMGAHRPPGGFVSGGRPCAQAYSTRWRWSCG